jgi:hypothetical protein
MAPRLLAGGHSCSPSSACARAITRPRTPGGSRRAIVLWSNLPVTGSAAARCMLRSSSRAGVPTRSLSGLNPPGVRMRRCGLRALYFRTHLRRAYFLRGAVGSWVMRASSFLAA